MIHYISYLPAAAAQLASLVVCEPKEWVSSHHSYKVHLNVEGLSRIPGGCWVVVASGDSSGRNKGISYNTVPPHTSISGSPDPSSPKIYQNQQAFCSQNGSGPHN